MCRNTIWLDIKMNRNSAYVNTANGGEFEFKAGKSDKVLLYLWKQYRTLLLISVNTTRIEGFRQILEATLNIELSN